MELVNSVTRLDLFISITRLRNLLGAADQLANLCQSALEKNTARALSIVIYGGILYQENAARGVANKQLEYRDSRTTSHNLITKQINKFLKFATKNNLLLSNIIVIIV